jgi:cobalamin biosynthesis protein CobT
MSETDQIASPTDALIADVRISRKRLKDEPPKSIAALVDELVNNVYPTIMAALEQIAEVDEVMQEVVEQQESYIHPRLAAQIFQTIALVGALINEVKKLEVDDLTRKKLADLMAALTHSVELSAMGVGEATTDFDVDADGGEDEDDDNDDGEDDGEDEDGNEDEDAPPVIEGEAPDTASNTDTTETEPPEAS